MKIALCGNHNHPFCTESELLWTLEAMGHTVIPFQENLTTAESMLSTCDREKVELFMYVHTHGWIIPGPLGAENLIYHLKTIGVKTCSFHLDRYWGLNRGDKREDLIGSHPFWHTDVVFTADGGNQLRFAERGINHVWLPPAVCARHCYRGTYKDEYACDVAFVGAGKYHGEYPQREQLMNWLQSVYKTRFRRFGGSTPTGVVRESALNNLYATVKVVVGDSCFAGSPYYWSDRVPETLGRGGFLIHPATEGLEIDGLVEFKAGHFDQLKEEIDYYLDHVQDRQTCIDHAMDDVKANHTYTNRMAFLLKEMGCTS